MKTLIAILCLLTLVACGESSKIQEAVRDRLNDPASANFKDVVVSEKGNRACTLWNAKNKMGGYGDWKAAMLEKQSSKWEVKDMEASPSSCTEAEFRLSDVREPASKEAKRKAMEMLSKARPGVSTGMLTMDCVHDIVRYEMKSVALAEKVAKKEVITDAETSALGVVEERLKAAKCEGRG